MIKCVVVDDEPLALQILQRYIDRTSELSLVRSCPNALEAYAVIITEEIDLLFLDIKMPFLNGIDFIKTLSSPPPVIFTTAFSEFAADSYELDAVDYLLKPITYDRFKKSIDKFFKQNAVKEDAQPYTYFKVDGRLIRIDHDTFIYAQSIKDYLIIFTTKGNYITHMTMKYLAVLLPSSEFLRVHRSYLIGIKHISSLDNQKLFLGDISVPIGENYKMEVTALKTRILKI